jgi:hypothetical protein
MDYIDIDLSFQGEVITIRHCLFFDLICSWIDQMKVGEVDREVNNRGYAVIITLSFELELKLELSALRSSLLIPRTCSSPLPKSMQEPRAASHAMVAQVDHVVGWLVVS